MFNVISLKISSIGLLGWILSSVAFTQTHFRYTSNTGNNATVAVPVTSNPNINGSPLVSGDEIGAFTPAGLCVGGVVWNETSTAITVWGDNEQTEGIVDGIEVGEEILYRVWRKSTDTEYASVSVTYSQGGRTYSVNGLYVLSSLNATAPPDPPTLVSPAENATGVSVAPTFSWNTSSYATSYRLQVALDSAFSALTIDQTGITGLSYAATGLTYSTRYYWRVSASNSGGSSGFSSSRAFTTIDPPPAVPVLSSPSNGAVNQPVALTLSWNPSSGAQSYHLQVATNSTFDTPLVNDATLTGTSHGLTGLTNNTTYYWRVNATNSFGSSGWSSVWSFVTIPLPPSIPTLSSPADSAIDQPTTLTLAWNQASGASTYHLQVSTDPSFGSTIVDDASLTGTSRAIGPLAANTLHYWRVRAANSGGLSDWSTVRRFTTIPLPPPQPTLVSPADVATNQQTTLTLTWEVATGATSYTVQVSTSPSFTTFVVNDPTVTGTSRQVGPLLNSTTYYWRVQAKNSGGTSNWSSIWAFTTVVAPPATPTLSSPANGETDRPTSFIVTWNAAARAQTYHLQVSTVSTFESTIVNDTTTGTSYQVSSLANSTIYYWRVMAMNAGGVSSWSAVWNFTTTSGLPAPPPIPTLASPANGATNQPMTLFLSWNGSSGASAYRLQLSTNSSFTTDLIDDSSLTTTSRQVSSLVAETKYYWRVSARNEGGSSGWSAVWDFTTSQTPPAVPTLVSPVTGSADQPTNVVLRWNSVPKSTSYHLQVSVNPSFSTMVYENSSITDTVRQMNGLANNTTYYWRVRARNDGGNSPWSTPWSFKTIVGPPSAPTLVSPADGSENQPTTVTLQWNGSAGATSYRCQVSTDITHSSPTFDDTLITGTSREIGQLANGTRYYWRVNAKNAGGSSQWSPSSSFSTASGQGPTLSSPPNGSTDQPLSLTLRWNVLPGATSYHVQLTTSDFSTPLLDDPSVSSTSRSVGPLANGTKYYWHVRARVVTVTTDWSETWSFTTIPAAPSTPNPVSPANGSADLPVNITFMWSSSNGATAYRLQVAKDIIFNTPVFDDATITGTSAAVGPLSYSTRYYWRVLASNSGGASGWSSPWSLTTSGGRAVATTLAPTNVLTTSAMFNGLVNANGYTTTVRFDYGTTTSYGTSVTANQNPVSGTSDVAVNASVGGLKAFTTYHYRVVAVNTSGASYGEDQTFRTAYPATILLDTTIAFPFYGAASEYKQTDYHLVGLPGASNTPAESVISQSNGADWQLYWDNGAPADYMVEFNGGPEFKFSVGRGFWMIHKGPWAISRSVPTAEMNPSQEVEIPLHQGWNIITNPFSSDIEWSSVKSINSLTEPIHSFESGWVNAATFKPYAGYYFENSDNRSILRIPSPGTSGTASSSKISSSGEFSNNWTVNVALVQGEAIDRALWFGVSPQAADTRDRLDARKPRGMAGIASMYFHRPDWDPLQSAFASDIRPGIHDISLWEFVVQGSGPGVVEISFEGIDLIPPQYDVYLVDRARLTETNLRTHPVYAFRARENASFLTVVVGSRDQVEARLKEFTTPRQFSLGANYPNPFNPSTSIPVDIAWTSHVELKLYNILGMEVRTLHTGSLEPGRHVFSWDGKDNSGKEVSSGVYICRLATNNGILETKKLTLLK